MKLKNNEIDLIINKREKNFYEKPYREAFLKHDLYACDSFDRCGLFVWYNELGFENNNDQNVIAFTKEKVDEIIDILKNKFKPITELKRGTRFISFLEKNEDIHDEIWFDDNGYGLEEMNFQWAEKNLENFNNLRKRFFDKDQEKQKFLDSTNK